ncbi:MAG: TolB family protein, partial [Acidobacteriota bacterium]
SRLPGSGREVTATLVVLRAAATREPGARQLENPPPETSAGWKRVLPWVLVGVLTIAAAILSVVHFGETRERPALVRARISKPENLTLLQGDSPVVISPDGRLLVVSGSDEDGVSHLWLHKMDSRTFEKLDGTAGANLSFWSPDSRFIGFFARGDEKLKKIAVSGGSPIALADASSNGSGGTWGREGIILFSPDRGGGPIYRVSSAGGHETQVTVLEESRQESLHSSPHFLPDGDHFLYAAKGRGHPTVIKLGAVSTGKSRILLDERMASGRLPFRGAMYAPPGYVLFRRPFEPTLMALPFDAASLEVTGEAFSLVEGLFRLAQHNFSASENGFLVYRGKVASSLTWWDRAGNRLDSLDDPGAYGQIALSPDEEHVSVGRTGKIWLLELSSGVFSRFTVDPAGGSDAVWSPDSRQLLFTSDRNRKGEFNLFVKSIGGGEAELLFQEEANQWPEDWSPDGRQAIYVSDQGSSVYGLDLRSPDRKPKLLFRSNFITDEHHVSPDGGWIAYGSIESGRWEVRLATFPDFAKIRQVSVGGGSQPLWRRDGRELFYLHPDGRLMSVEVKLGPDPETSAPRALFQTGIAVHPGWNQYCVSRLTGNGS